MRARVRGRSTGTTEGEWIPEMLVAYLSNSIENPDIYEFSFMIPSYAASEGLDPDAFEDPGDLPNDGRDFIRWLKSPRGRKATSDLAFNDPTGVPAFLHLDDPERLGPARWLLHFTESSPFSSFDRGATLENLALTKWRLRRDYAKCPDNLDSDKTGPFEVVFAFAFDAELKIPFRIITKKYGKNAVLFRSDLAVRAYHAGDDEDQVIFPVCSEYDAIPIWGVNGRGGGTIEVDGEERELDSLEDILTLADRKQIGRAHGSTAQRRWNGRFLGRRARAFQKSRR